MNPARTAQRAPRGDRSKRLLDLVMLLLRARAPVTFRDIREQFLSYKTSNVEAGLRAFERDKADLLELGVPIRYITPDEDDSLEEGGYVVDLKRYPLPDVSFTADELSALVLAISVARAVPGGPTPKIVDLALKKLAFDAPEPLDTPGEFPPSIGSVVQREPVLVHFPAKDRSEQREFSDRFAQLETATRGNKNISFQYRAANSASPQQRAISPYGLFYRQGTWLVVGRCHLRDDIRSFRVDRISDLKVAPRPKSKDFDKPTDFDVRSYAARSPWTFTPEPSERVALEIAPEAAAVANEDFGPAAERSQRGSSTVIEFMCGNPDFVVSRVLQAKGGLRVCKGDQVLARLRAEVAKVQQLYKTGAN